MQMHAIMCKCHMILMREGTEALSPCGEHHDQKAAMFMFAPEQL